ncbi:MAG: hypothetical protein ACRD0K_04260 [Egibacteraceae bacterium]
MGRYGPSGDHARDQRAHRPAYLPLLPASGWPNLLEASFPSWTAERLLVHVALDLWNSTEATSLYDAVTRLDEGNFTHPVEALRLRRPLPAQDAS